MTQPSDILFQAISTMTGGLVSDLTTAMLAIVGIGFLLMGFDYLREAFEGSMNKRAINKSLDSARSYKKMADSMDDQVSKDYLNARYRNEIRNAARR